MNVLEVMQEQMELANLDTALDSLQEAIKTKPEGGYRKYISRLNFLTNAIHNRVWSDGVSSNRIKKEIFPLFQKAYLLVEHFITRGYDPIVDHCLVSINLKLKNLEGYLKGEGSYDFLDKTKELRV